MGLIKTIVLMMARHFGALEAAQPHPELQPHPPLQLQCQ